MQSWGSPYKLHSRNCIACVPLLLYTMRKGGIEMDVTSIAAASIYLHQSQVQESAGIAIAKQVLNVQEVAAEALIETIRESVPSFGHKLDIRV